MFDLLNNLLPFANLVSLIIFTYGVCAVDQEAGCFALSFKQDKKAAHDTAASEISEMVWF